jgi:uncharacterized protein YyaL (SSP411 family)
MREKLLARRAGRIRPGWDDKVLADWNGLAIAGIAHAARVFERQDWLDMAIAAFRFVSTTMDSGGRMMHSWRANKLTAPASASDYANMIWGALRLHQTTNEASYLDAAQRWCQVLNTHYWSEGGGYAFAANDTPDVIVRMCTGWDDATPNANAVMLTNLAQLCLLTGDQAYMDRAEAVRLAFAAEVAANPLGHCGLLANSMDLEAPQQVVVVSPNEADPSSILHRALMQVSLPGAVEQWLAEEQVPTAGPLAGKRCIDGKATAYACIGPQCSLPVVDAGNLTSLLRRQRQVVPETAV